MAQTDIKKLVAYSSVSHMGYVLLGMAAFTAAGINGAVLQMFNHGTITAMLFLCVGVIYDRAHHREINGFGGLGLQMPRLHQRLQLRLLRRPGPARPERLRQRGHDLHRRLPGLPHRDHHQRPGHHHRRGLRAVDAAARVPGPEERQVRRACPTSARREMFTLVPIGIIVLLLGVYPMPVLNLMKVSLNNLIKVVAG